MEEFVDRIWFQIVESGHQVKILLDMAFSPLNSLGPAVCILVIASLTVLITKFLTRVIQTKRYRRLKEEFLRWHALRQEAIKCKEEEKGRLIARNIDEAKLNRIYYDFFLEGFLLSLVTKYLPILSALAYVNEAYKPEFLKALSGRDYLFQIPVRGREGFFVGPNLWYLFCILLAYLGWLAIGWIGTRRKIEKRPATDGKCLSPTTTVP